MSNVGLDWRGLDLIDGWLLMAGRLVSVIGWTF